MASGEMKLSMILSVIDKATGPLKGVSAAFEKAGQAGEALKKAGEGLRAARENVADFTGRLKDGLQSIAEPAMKVETALAKLGTVMEPIDGPISESLDRVKDAALAWQRAHVGSAESYITATHKMVGAGLQEADAIAGAEVAMRVANATMGDASGIASALGAVYGQLGDKTRPAKDELARLGDVLTRAQGAFDMADIGALSGAMKDAGPAARRFGVSIEHVATYLGALESAGISGGQAGKALGDTLKALEGASKKLGFEIVRTADGGVDLVGSLAALEGKVGSVADMSPATAAALQEAFGPGAALALEHLLGQSDNLEAALAKVQGSAGATASAAQAMEATMAGKMKLVDQQIESLKVQLATGFMPALEKLLPHVTAATEAFSKFATEHPELVATAGTIAVMTVAAGTLITPLMSAGGAFLSVGGHALKAVSALGTFAVSAVSTGASIIAGMIPALTGAIASAWAFTAALLANPITWIVIAIIAAVALIYVYWEPISEFFSALWDGIKAAFFAAADAVSGAWDKVLGFFTGIWTDIKAAFNEGFITGILKVIETFSPIVWIAKGLNAVLEWMFGFSLFDAGSNIVGTIVDGIKAMASKPVEAMKSIVGKVRNLLPFSPAKDGPLRDLHRVKIIETVAENMHAAPMVDAMRLAADDTMSALTAAQIPRPAPIPSADTLAAGRAGAPSGGGGDTVSMNVTINLGGGGSRSWVEELEAWLRDPSNARRIASAVQAHQARERRTEFA